MPCGKKRKGKKGRGDGLDAQAQFVENAKHPGAQAAYREAVRSMGDGPSGLSEMWAGPAEAW